MKQIVFSAALAILTVQVSVGQTLKTYSGLYEGGKATYTYYEDENGERVKHGKFTYSYATTLSASGNYKDGIKDGKWIYKNKTTVINYVDGSMEGTLTNAGKTFQMKNNRITGRVKKIDNSRDENLTISGQFDEEGFPDGTWTKSYESDGNLYIDTEKYVHGLLIAKQRKNESTGEITRYEFNDVDPQEYLSAYKPDKDSTIVGKLICQEKVYFKQGEENTSYIQDYLMPEVFGEEIRTIVEQIKKVRGFGSEQKMYEGIPFKEIVVIGINEAPNEGKVFTTVEQMPQFPGGDEKLLEYISANLQYPEEAKEREVRGRVIVSFIVNSDGSISDVQVVRGRDPSLDNEALRVVNSMPHWTPGRQNGTNVRVRYSVPVTFNY